MNSWMVELHGAEIDLRELQRLNSLSQVNIVAENNCFYLTAEEFDLHSEVREVLSRAAEIVKVINAIAYLEIENWENISVKDAIRKDSQGNIHRFLIAEPGHFRMRGGNVTFKITRADGTVEESPIPQNTLSSFFKTSQNDANVNKALRIFGGREHTWSNLYIIYEIIESDVGGKSVIVSNNWCSGKKIENFKRTANSLTAVGDEARHGKETSNPPPSPMLLDEAKTLIENILKKWLATK